MRAYIKHPALRACPAGSPRGTAPLVWVVQLGSVDASNLLGDLLQEAASKAEKVKRDEKM